MKFAFFTCLLIILALMAATETVISQKPLNARNMKKIAGESPSRCAHPLLPGLMAMSRGIDLTTLDLFPANIRADFGFKKTLFEFNCSFNQTWQHPTVQTARLYSQPNYVTVNTMSAGKLSTDERFISSLFDFKLAMGTSVGINVPLEIGSFSASGGLKIALDFLLRENRSVIEASATISASQMDFEAPKKLKLNSQFIDMLERLPATYEAAPEKYEQFLDTFGTHFFESAKFGGYLCLNMDIANNYFYATAKGEIHSNMQLNLLAIAGGYMNSSANASLISEKFKNNTRKRFYRYGGGFNTGEVENHENMRNWHNTVLHDPWLFGGKLSPIESLITNETLQQEMKKAVSFKRARVFVNDLKATLHLGGFTLQPKEQQRLQAIEAYLANPMAGQGNMAKMGKDVYDMFTEVQDIRDRSLLAEYAQKLTDLSDRQFFAARHHFTEQYCFSDQIAETLREEFALFTTLKRQAGQFLNSSGGQLDGRSVQELVRSVGQFVKRHEPVSFCGGDATCHRCTQKKVDYAENWRSYVNFYLDPLVRIWKFSLRCKFNLAKLCKSPLKSEIDAQHSKQEQLTGYFEGLLRQKEAPHKLRMVNLVRESNQFVDTYLSKETPTDLCPSDASCQQCLEYNVDCWKSRPVPDYTTDDYEICQNPEEWRLIKYTPKQIEPNCTEGKYT